MPGVTFSFHSGVRNRLFHNVRLCGSWNEEGRSSAFWSEQVMQEVVLPDGSLSYQTEVVLEGVPGQGFAWGVKVDTPHRGDQWAIAAEVDDWQRTDRVREFRLQSCGQHETYYLTRLSQLGANIQRLVQPDLVRFAVWAPHAQAVSVVFGDRDVGYIDDAGGGVLARFPMQRQAAGVWETELRLADPTHTVYMFELVNDAGQTVYRTDLYSRCQVGSGSHDPGGAPSTVPPIELDGRVSCSNVMDPARVEHPVRSDVLVDEATFWSDEFNPHKPVTRVPNELVIYELHVGALGFGQDRPGNLDDAMALLPYLEELGVNAVELLPIAEFSGTKNWGYGATHFLAIEFSSGGPDHLKAFVKACHQRGIAVILDVVYNHYAPSADRAEWMYDTTSHDKNMYYWYEGSPSHYPGANPDGHGGYIDNLSTGYAPAFHDEMVRSLFVSSAVMFVLEYHIDGFRVDQTTSIHSYPVLHADGSPATQAQIFGAKFLKEFGRTLRLVAEDAVLLAEDHSTWEELLKSVWDGGMGFSAKWYNDFYHHLIGDTRRSPNLLASAGYGGNWALDMGYFGSLLESTGPWSVVFPESHDEAGNSAHDGERSRRTLLVAVNKSDPEALDRSDVLRGYAEARSRVVAGLSLLSAGVPMFFMGEEVGAAKYYINDNDDWFYNREDLHHDKSGKGRHLFRFYQDLLALRRRLPALHSGNIKVVHTHNDNRVIAFKRWGHQSEALIVATLSNSPFSVGYAIDHEHIPGASWKEVFSSDASAYGGLNYGNGGATVSFPTGHFEAVLPPNGFVVFQRM